VSTTAQSLDAWAEASRAQLAGVFEARLGEPPGGDPGRLLEAVRYSLLAPGKRIRPLLALAAAETFAPVSDEVLLACAAVELVHCYSLIHDDLPAMDDDDFRRGRPSNHKVFGDAIAILAGDGLLTLAFDWIAEAGVRARRPEGFLRAAGALARGAGVFGMVRGQARDLREPAPATIADLERLHGEKTAALFRAALEVGGLAAGADPDVVPALAAFGYAYGIAFQHADDLADAEHGRLAREARQRVADLIDDAIAGLGPFGPRATRLADLARALTLA
jgi:geranylgeranyl diphosphate synthase, type II